MQVIGIAGGSGSGKSTLVEQLLAGDSGLHIAVLPYDTYYHTLAATGKDYVESHNWDHPSSLDTSLFLEHIDRLIAGEPIHRPIYDFATHSRVEATILVGPRPVLLLEGILLFAHPDIVSRIDLRIFVDTSPDTRLQRRMTRDTKERGRSVESVSHQYHATVKPMHDRFVEPSKRHAHLIVPWEEHNHTAVEVLRSWIRHQMVRMVDE